MKIQLTQQIIVNNKHRWYSMLDELCFKSKNLYNYALYQIRQYYKNTNYYTKDDIECWCYVDEIK